MAKKKLWQPHDYTPLFLTDEPTHTIKEIREEYSRNRDIAVKRAKRFERAGMTAQAAYLREIFPTLSEMEKEISAVVEKNKTLPAKKQLKVPSVADYLSRGHATIEERSYGLKGIHELQKLIKEETGEIVPVGEVLAFDQYMKSWRLSAFSKSIVASGDASEMYRDEYQEIGGSFSDFYTIFKSM